MNEEIQKIYGYYTRKIHNGSRLTEGSKLKIKTRLKLFSVEQLLEAIDRFSKNKWWMENNGKRGVAWFFHSDDRIDQFLNLEPEKKRQVVNL